MVDKTGGLPPFIQQNATTAGPTFVKSAITSSSSLQAKTRRVVLTSSPDGYVAHLFRESGKVPGQYSRDVYLWTGREWSYKAKDDQKYPAPPYEPSDAERLNVAEVDVWTMVPMTAEEIDRLRALLVRV